MQKNFQKTLHKTLQKTLSIGLSGLLAIGIANASDTMSVRQPNVLHEMVPHVVLPETIQYNKTVKNMPGTGYTSATYPYVATYVAFPSYQVPYSVSFRPVGQSVYPVSPKLLPGPVPEEQPEHNTTVKEETALREINGKDVVISHRDTEPIRLATSSDEIVPTLPVPNNVANNTPTGNAIVQTGIFCQQPAQPPSAWAFSSPLFKVASVPAGWGGQMGGITQNGLKNCSQQVGFSPANPTGAGTEASVPGAVSPQGIPLSTFQMGRNWAPNEAQTQVLPNGMILLTLPQGHNNCGLIRCRSGQPKVLLLPPAGYGQLPGVPTGAADPAVMQTAMMSGGLPGMGIPSMPPYMPVAQQPMMQYPAMTQMQQPMMLNPMMLNPTIQNPMMPQMQTVPIMAMTPMGPTLIGFQQMGGGQQMGMMNPMMQQMPQMAMAMSNPVVAAQVSGESANETSPVSGQSAPGLPATGVAPEAANPMTLIATPFGYMIQVPADAQTGTLQGDAAGQLAQMQQFQMPQFQMSMNPYAGLYATPFGYIAMNQSAGRLGSPMMNIGYQPFGMPGSGQSSMSAMEMLQLMAFINSGKQQPRRARMFERIAERREARRASCDSDPFAQLMQAWTTPYVAPDMALRMPSQNAYPYGYFGAQAMPISTANYGGYHNLYMGNTTYPGLY